MITHLKLTINYRFALVAVVFHYSLYSTTQYLTADAAMHTTEYCERTPSLRLAEVVIHRGVSARDG